MRRGQDQVARQEQRTGPDLGQRIEAADMTGDLADAPDLGGAEAERRAERRQRPAIVLAVDDVDRRRGRPQQRESGGGEDQALTRP
jgi:hypothetical protein